MRVRWTSRAAEQLADALDYLANESPAAAFQVGVRISRSEALLRRHPRIGREGIVPDCIRNVIENPKQQYLLRNGAVSEPVHFSGS